MSQAEIGSLASQGGLSSVPNDVNHVAFCTANMKMQLTFFTQVIGMRLKGLFWMHGVADAMHAFLELNEQCCLSFVYHPEVATKEPLVGISLPADTTDTVPAGVHQHIAFNLNDLEALNALIKRVRAHGYMITDAIDHDMYQSAYMLAPENIWIEFTCVERAFSDIDLDEEVLALCDISSEELEAMKNPSLDLGAVDIDVEKTKIQQRVMGERMVAMLKKMQASGKTPDTFTKKYPA